MPMNQRTLRPKAGVQLGTPASLLLRFDGTFADSSPNALAVTAVGNAEISTYQNKYGSGSLSIDGFGSRATIPAASVLGLGTGDFTIEAWVWLSNLSANNTIVDIGGFQNGILLRISGSSQDAAYIAGTAINWNASSHVPAQQWSHVAMTRQGSDVRFFVNGAQVHSTTNSSDAGNIASAMIGQASHTADSAEYGPVDAFSGYIDDLRIVKGTAVYTANFTPPTAPLSAYV